MFNFNIDIDRETAKNQERIASLMDSVEQQLEATVTPEMTEGIRKIYITGCGDSYFAAQGARLFFEKCTGLDIEPIEAMEFSRYTVKNIRKDALVLAVSNSGRVSRTIEAILQARARHVRTIALTGHDDRSVAEHADAAIVGALPNIRLALGSMSARVEGNAEDALFERLAEPCAVSRSAQALGMDIGLDFLLFMLGAYMNSLILLYCTAIRIGCMTGRISQQLAERHRQDILRSVGISAKTAAACLAPIEALAKSFAAKDAFLFIGAGPAYAAAALSAAKLFEQPHINGVAQQLEEWAHLQFFFTRPDGIPVFVIVPPGESRDRALEQISGIKKLGGTVIAICDETDDEVRAAADAALPIAGSLPEELTPLVYGVPGQLFAVTMLELRGQPPIPAPYSFKQMMQVNFSQIYGSRIKSD